MTSYHDSTDLAHLRELRKAAPREFEAWQQLDAIVRIEDGSVPRKYRELIALAVAHTTQCAYCIDVHARSATEVGATVEEIAETILIAAALRSGAAGAHGALTMRLLHDAETGTSEDRS
ncbi:carboxymuconolactone decarboxylase family protein [Streptomyces sp. NPDC005708]|uniref:carboxymuconolactone decarboxylase family protein n=1 Tax=Streptomyces sp. NPDC005708 TaxID=3154564 RepID=UPI0033E2EED2